MWRAGCLESGLQRGVGKSTFTDNGAVLAGLLHHVPMDKLRHILLLVRPDTILRRHRNLLARRHAATSPAAHGADGLLRSPGLQAR
ncbi:hypothetical protein [Streptomyces sp. DB-54]